jgi:ankyrin repeat protein
MHAAAYSGHAEMLKVMAELGADVNVTQDAPAQAGNTPLHSACERFQANAVKTLMELGADDSLKNVNGLTAAHIVANRKSYFGGNDRERMDKNRLKILETLKTLDEPNNDGITPLMLLQFENLNFLVAAQQILLSRGVDVNRKDSRGRTALILATDNHCYKDAVKELIRAGAELNAADQKGKTALHYALAYGSQDVARFLIKKGADYNRADNGGVTPVSLAAEKGYDTVLELMTDIK